MVNWVNLMTALWAVECRVCDRGDSCFHSCNDVLILFKMPSVF